MQSRFQKPAKRVSIIGDNNSKVGGMCSTNRVTRARATVAQLEKERKRMIERRWRGNLKWNKRLELLEKNILLARHALADRNVEFELGDLIPASAYTQTSPTHLATPPLDAINKVLEAAVKEENLRYQHTIENFRQLAINKANIYPTFPAPPLSPILARNSTSWNSDYHPIPSPFLSPIQSRAQRDERRGLRVNESNIKVEEEEINYSFFGSDANTLSPLFGASPSPSTSVSTLDTILEHEFDYSYSGGYNSEPLVTYPLNAMTLSEIGEMDSSSDVLSELEWVSYLNEELNLLNADVETVTIPSRPLAFDLY